MSRGWAARLGAVTRMLEHRGEFRVSVAARRVPRQGASTTNVTRSRMKPLEQQVDGVEDALGAADVDILNWESNDGAPTAKPVPRGYVVTGSPLDQSRRRSRPRCRPLVPR